MPLSEKARIEVYLPDADSPSYAQLLEVFEQELTHAFGGCSVIRSVDGFYLSRIGAVIHDHVNLLFTDAPYGLNSDYDLLSRYADQLRDVALAALNEEVVLVVVYPVFHSS